MEASSFFPPWCVASAKAPAAEAGKPGGVVPSPRGAHDTAAPPAPEELPDDAGPAGDALGPTGMELIQRQLGAAPVVIRRRLHSAA